MKHALLLIVLVIAFYTAWQFADKKERTATSRFIARHVFRLGLLVLAVILLLLAATQLPSTSII